MYNLLYSANDRNAGTFLGYQILSTQNLSQSFGHFKFAPYHHSIIAQITITKTKIIWISSFSCNYAVLVAEKWHPGRKNCVSWWAQVIPHRGTVLGNKMNILLLLPSLYQREQQRVTTPPPLWWTSGTLPRAFNTWVSVQFIYYFVLVTWWIGWAGPGPRTDQADGFGTVTMSVRLSCRPSVHLCVCPSVHLCLLWGHCGPTFKEKGTL